MQVGEWKAHEYINEYYIHVISSTPPQPIYYHHTNRMD